MFNIEFFTQPCPTCGRKLNVRLEYANEEVCCQHCHAEFVAKDPEWLATPQDSSQCPLLRRADELLELVAM